MHVVKRQVQSFERLLPGRRTRADIARKLLHGIRNVRLRPAPYDLPGGQVTICFGVSATLFIQANALSRVSARWCFPAFWQWETYGKFIEDLPAESACLGDERRDRL
jgi:hypothetical protein